MRLHLPGRLAAAVIVAVCFFLAAAVPALAHAQLTASDPADGAVLAQAPSQLTLNFSEPVRPLVARLIGPDGRIQTIADVGDRDATIVVALPSGLAEGTHVLSWRVTSTDGHPVGGGLLFSIGAPSAAAPTAPQQSDLSVQIGLWLARFLIACGLVFGVGGAGFRSFYGGGVSAGRFVSAALAGGLLGALALVPLQGLDALGAPLTAAFGTQIWTTGLWATSYGPATLIAAAAQILALASLQSVGAGRILGLLSLLLAGFAFAAAGHAASAPPRWLMAPALFVHTLAVLFWLGALAPLAAALASGGAGAAALLGRFSKAIPLAVAALLGSGIVIALFQVQTPAALVSSDYGRVLLIKLGLVAGMLVLALVNRYVLTRPAANGDAEAVRRLSRSVTAEVLLGVAVIGVLGLWRFTPPPRAMAADPARYEVQQVRASHEDVTALLSIHPPITGPVRVEVGEITADGKKLTPLGVTVELGKPTYGLGPFVKEVGPDQNGIYRADGFVLPLDGFWVVRATILVSEFRSVTVTDVFDVRKPSN